jgi:hypothetical protein
VGYVLVTYHNSGGSEARMRRALYGGDSKINWRVTVARWRTDYQRWTSNSPRGEQVPNVTAWMPLPEPYEQGGGNEA